MLFPFWPRNRANPKRASNTVVGFSVRVTEMTALWFSRLNGVLALVSATLLAEVVE